MTWYEDEVAQLIKRRDVLPYKPQTIFYGSSTIRLWDSLYEDFKICRPVNLGFGGSTLEACIYFFDRIVAPVKTAQCLYLYAGDNDLGDGKEPEEVFQCFKELAVKIDHYFPGIKWHYISVKPSISRWTINEKIKRTNKLIEDEIKAESSNAHFINIYKDMLDFTGYPRAAYFEEDGLHLSREGYDVLKKGLLTQSSCCK